MHSYAKKRDSESNTLELSGIIVSKLRTSKCTRANTQPRKTPGRQKRDDATGAKYQAIGPALTTAPHRTQHSLCFFAGRGINQGSPCDAWVLGRADGRKREKTVSQFEVHLLFSTDYSSSCEHVYIVGGVFVSKQMSAVARKDKISKPICHYGENTASLFLDFSGRVGR